MYFPYPASNTKPGGETIRTLQQQHGVRINVEQPDGSQERRITLTGDPQAIEATKAGIMEKIGPAPVRHIAC